MDVEDGARVDRHEALDGLAIRLGGLVWPECLLVQAAEDEAKSKVAKKFDNGIVSIEKHRAYNQASHIIEPVSV